MFEESIQNTRRFIKVVSTGGFAEKVPEGTEGAVRREWTVPSRGGEPAKSGVVFEKLYKGISGYITRASINDSEFGTSLLVNVASDGDEVTVTMSLDSEFGQDFLKKAPNIDPSEPVSLNAWNLEDEAGKTRRGLSIKQNGEKIVDAYTSYDAETKTRTYNNGYPEPPKGVMTSDKWKLYFMNTRVWLRDYTEENSVLDKFSGSDTPKNTAIIDLDEGEPINLADIPF